MSLKIGNGFHYIYPCNKKLDKPTFSSLKHIPVDTMVSLVIWLKNNYLWSRLEFDGVNMFQGVKTSMKI
jgi:hypothetical protein